MEKDGGQYEYLPQFCGMCAAAGRSAADKTYRQCGRRYSSVAGYSAFARVIYFPQKRHEDTACGFNGRDTFVGGDFMPEKRRGQKFPKSRCAEKSGSVQHCDYTDASQAGVYYWKVTVQTENQAAESSVGMFIVR
ncbi:hypothetical protein CHS0354_001952 [Potamilus streckersoni]|uniref:Uncharacterized protein n=1 Tax=Potamilus streckersoni TaxID=2493646 RepID=A0AAE0T5C4_9BIVA|nr:hypothetical protein CHS0354_001952 [Potamilus streckersoni]